MEVGLVLLSGQNFRISFLEISSTNFFFILGREMGGYNMAFKSLLVSGESSQKRQRMLSVWGTIAHHCKQCCSLGNGAEPSLPALLEVRLWVGAGREGVSAQRSCSWLHGSVSPGIAVVLTEIGVYAWIRAQRSPCSGPTLGLFLFQIIFIAP